MLRVDSYPIVARTAFPFTLVGVLLLALLPERLLEILDMAFTSNHDKLNHAAAFAVLAALGSLGWPEQKARLVVFLLLIGAAIEILQGTQLIARDRDVFDWLADCAGMICGLVVAGLITRLVGALR